MKRKTRKDCKCDCGHKKEHHYLGEGQCRYCGCTWFHPCIARVKKNIAKKKEKTMKAYPVVPCGCGVDLSRNAEISMLPSFMAIL